MTPPLESFLDVFCLILVTFGFLQACWAFQRRTSSIDSYQHSCPHSIFAKETTPRSVVCTHLQGHLQYQRVALHLHLLGVIKHCHWLQHLKPICATSG